MAIPWGWALRLREGGHRVSQGRSPCPRKHFIYFSETTLGLMPGHLIDEKGTELGSGEPEISSKVSGTPKAFFIHLHCFPTHRN